jgi:hypothetical protein
METTVVLIDGAVYSTADSMNDGLEMADRLIRETGMYAECVSWEKAEEMGLVS